MPADRRSRSEGVEPSHQSAALPHLESGFGARVAFFGATSLLARELRGVIEGRAFITSELKLYDTVQEGAVTEFAGEAMVVTAPDEDSIYGLDIAFMCGDAAQTRPYLDWGSRRGYVTIDLSGASRQRSDAPLVHSEINPGAILNDGRVPEVIAVPHAVSHNLSTLLHAAGGAGRVATVHAVSLRPAADLGEPGIDELYKQTLGLLNFSAVPNEAFGRQIAFNVVPSQAGGTREVERLEDRVLDETARLTGLHADRLCLMSAFVPMFHGHVMAVTITFNDPRDADALGERMSLCRGVRLVDDPSFCSPVDLAGEESVAVIGLTPDAHLPARVSFWSICDNLKGGSTANSVRIAERVMDARRAAQ